MGGAGGAGEGERQGEREKLKNFSLSPLWGERSKLKGAWDTSMGEGASISFSSPHSHCTAGVLCNKVLCVLMMLLFPVDVRF